MNRNFASPDLTLAYTDVGSGREGTVVCLHSLGTNRGMWDPVTTRLVGAGFRVLCPDARGHGESVPSASPADPRDWVADLAGLLHHAGVECAHLVGVSMGAAQALDFGLIHPDRVGSIVIGGAFGTLDPDSAAAKVEALAGGAASLGLAAWADRYVETTLFSQDPNAREAVRAAIASMSLKMYAASARTCFSPRAGDLARLENPVLIIWGTADVKTPRALSENLEKTLPRSRIVEVEGAGHLPNVDAPEQFAEFVVSHIRSSGEGSIG